MVKSIVGVLTPASFEQSHKNILDAPAKGITDNLSTVSAQIIMGKHIRMGTGYFDIHVDTKKLTGNVFKRDDVIEHDTSNINELERTLRELRLKTQLRENKTEEEEDVY
jgi:DNA-directed RNA polymerase beta' subunit